MGSFYINTDHPEDINLAEAFNFDNIELTLTPTTPTFKDSHTLHDHIQQHPCGTRARSNTLRPFESFSYIYADTPPELLFMKPTLGQNDPPAVLATLEPQSAPSKREREHCGKSGNVLKRQRRVKGSVADLHCLHPSADFEIHCPWSVGDPSADCSPAALWRCGQFVLLDHFAAHLQTHLDRIGSGQANQDVACRVPLANGLPCATAVIDANRLKIHILSQDHVLIEGRQRQPDGTWGAIEVLKKMTCRYCSQEYSMYVGGNGEALRRHVQAKHPKQYSQLVQAGSSSQESLQSA